MARLRYLTCGIAVARGLAERAGPAVRDYRRKIRHSYRQSCRKPPSPARIVPLPPVQYWFIESCRVRTAALILLVRVACPLRARARFIEPSLSDSGPRKRPERLWTSDGTFLRSGIAAWSRTRCGRRRLLAAPQEAANAPEVFCFSPPGDPVNGDEALQERMAIMMESNHWD